MFEKNKGGENFGARKPADGGKEAENKTQEENLQEEMCMSVETPAKEHFNRWEKGKGESKGKDS